MAAKKWSASLRCARTLAIAVMLYTSSSAFSSADSNGRLSEIVVSSAAARPTDIIRGNDGSFWFIDLAANKIGKLTPRGTVTEFLVPTSPGNVRGITVGPDNSIWFTEWIGGKIGRITSVMHPEFETGS